MGKNFLTNSIILSIVFLILFGCASNQPGVQISATGGDKVSKPTELAKTDTVVFDPMELGDDGILVPRPPEIVDEAPPDSSLKLPVRFIEDQPAQPAMEEQWEEVIRPGFRVQIFASSGVDAARLVEKEAKDKFTEGVYLSYDPPNYKVRIGNCIERSEAQLLLQKAVRLGFNDAWIVRDNIVVKVKKTNQP